MGDDLSVCQTSCDNHPQVCIDWCDATAYCKAVGKRLCGKIGGGANAYADHSNADRDQWYNACTSHGANLYAGGSRADTCNIVTSEKNTRPVPTLTTCQSAVPGYTGVFDLTGNVWEWEDSCDGLLGAADSCHYRGGDYRVDDRNGGLQCGATPGSVSPGGNRRDATAETTGFRCCSL